VKFTASSVELSSTGGEYFQAMLTESESENSPYVLLQNSFEFSPGAAYFECHNLDLSGQGCVKRCELRRTSLEIEAVDSNEPITVLFNEPDEKIGNLGWILRIILNQRVPFVNSSGIPEYPIDGQDVEFDI